MNKAQGQISKRHHYIPKFYLKKWCVDGNLCEFSKIRGEVKPQRKSPKATGFRDNLYKIQGIEGKQSVAPEDRYFKPLDNNAAIIRDKIMDKGTVCLNPPEKLEFAQWLVSLDSRTPEALENLRKALPQFYRKPSMNVVRHFSKKSDMGKFGVWRALQRTSDIRREILLFEVLMRTKNEGYIQSYIANMPWHLLEYNSPCRRIWTSDRPLVRWEPLGKELGHMSLPLSPTKILLITHSLYVFLEWKSRDSKFIIDMHNRAVAENARSFVYSVDDSELSAVEKYHSSRHIDDIHMGFIRYARKLKYKDRNNIIDDIH